jgi:hypothetical protein
LAIQADQRAHKAAEKVHPDLDACTDHQGGELSAGKLRALIRTEDILDKFNFETEKSR